MPNSLTCICLPARGSAPWRPVAVSVRTRASVPAASRGVGPGTPRTARPPRAHCLVPQQSAARTRLAGEDVPGHPHRRRTDTPRRRTRAWLRNVRLIPCRSRATASLGPAHLLRSTRAGEPASSSALGVPVRVVATPTKICTAGTSTHARACASPLPARPPTTLLPSVHGVGTALQHHPFSARVDSAGMSQHTS